MNERGNEGAGDAVRRYKQLAAGNDEALSRMRAYDHARAEALRQDLVRVWQELAEAAERERVSRAVSRAYWETAVEELWKERWLPVPPPPEPTPVGQDADLLRSDADVERTHETLHETLRRQPLLPRRRSDDPLPED
ncbi:MAG TPA: hypothetical protein VHW44_04250 [Pseudonocardiaceae bacterium]|jgi:hypothetical protein|nr:hypothetical protein [Pseudonocardiaceae bacterium]